MTNYLQRRLNRRSLLAGAGGFAAATGLTGLLAACGGGSSNSTSSTGSGGGSSSSSTSATGSPSAQGGSTSTSQAGQPAATPQKGGTMIIGQTASPVSLDPALEADWNSRESIGYMFDHMVRIGPKNDAVPWLATKWESTKDGLTWTFHLVSGVKFHDGTTLDANAVKFNLDRLVDKQVNSKELATFDPYYKSSKAADATTLQVTLKKPWANFISELSWAPGMVSPTAVQKAGKNFANHPIGSGPFKFQSYTPDSNLKMVRNENYWKGAPLLDGVTINIIPNVNTQVLDMETKKLDWMYGVLAKDVSLLKQHGLDVLTRTVPDTQMLMMNLASGPTAELPVRQAIAHAINRDAIIKTVFKGFAEKSQAGVPKISPYFHPDVPGVDYDVDKAKSLLDQAGWKAGSGGVRSKDGKPLSLVVLATTQDSWPDISQIIQEELSQIGIQAKIQSQEWGTFLNSMRAGNYGVAYWSLGGFTFQSEDGTVNMLSTAYWNVSQITKQPNLKSVMNQIDTLITKEQGQTTLDERSATLKQFQQLVLQNQLLAWLWHTKAIFAVQPTVHDYTLNNWEFVFLEKAWKS